MPRGNNSKDSRIDPKKVFQKIFGFVEGDNVYLGSYFGNRKIRVKVIKIFPDEGLFSNLVLIERDGKREITGRELLRP